MTAIASRILLAAVAGWLMTQAGCSHSGSRPPVATGRLLSANEAAEVAARLANDQCERQYQKRPFKPEQHPAIFHDGIYRWGGLDVGGPGGMSALVTFRQDGSESSVEVYFSSDALRPPRPSGPTPPDVQPEE